MLDGGDVRNGSLKGRDIRDGSISARDVRNGTIRAADLAPGALPERGAPGAKGETGPRGEPGTTGDAGPPGPGTKATGIALTGADSTLTLSAGGDWKTVAERTFSLEHDGKLVFGGALEEQNTSKTDPSAVELRILHNGHAHDLPSGTTLSPATAGASYVSAFVCNGFAGDQAVQLQARAIGSDVNIGDRNFTAAAANGF